MYFTVRPTSDGDWRARVYGDNGELMFLSEPHETAAGAKDAMAVLQREAAAAKPKPVLKQARRAP
jgi:uncharacterized protein YegP (UPF0339 family)